MDTDKERAALARLKGQLCVYKEKRIVLLVTVVDVAVDDSGVALSLNSIPEPLFGSSATREFDVSSSWDWLSGSTETVLTASIGWKLVCGEGLVEDVLSFAGQSENHRDLVRFISRC